MTVTNTNPDVEQGSGAIASTVELGSEESNTSTHSGEKDLRKSGLGSARTRWQFTALLVLTEVMGTGVLSLPYAAATLGWVAAVLAVVVFGFFGAFSGVLLGEVKMANPSVGNLRDAARELVGPRFATFTQACMLLNWGSLAIYYIITMSNSIAGIFASPSGFLSCSVGRTAVAAAILLIPTQCRDFDSISKVLSVPSILAVIVAVLIVIVAVIVNGGNGENFGQDTTVGPSRGANPLTFLQALATFVFAYKSSIFMEVLAEMKSPSKFPKALAYSFFTMGFVYLAVVVISYGYKGSAVPGFLPDILPAGPAKIVADLLLLFHIIVAYVVVAQPLHIWLHSKLFPSTLYQNTNRGKLHWFLVCFGYVVFSWLIANLIPFFADVQSLIGSLFGAPIMFGWPALFYALTCKRKLGEGGSWRETLSYMGWKRATLCCLFFFVFLPLFLVLGTAGSLWSIADDIRHSPAPFRCQ